MKKSLLLGLGALLFSGSLFADCPQVGGFTVNPAAIQNNDRCIYASNRVVIGARMNPKLCTRGFILTDPHFKLAGCKVNPANNRCVCVIVRNR